MAPLSIAMVETQSVGPVSTLVGRWRPDRINLEADIQLGGGL